MSDYPKLGLCRCRGIGLIALSDTGFSEPFMSKQDGSAQVQVYLDRRKINAVQAMSLKAQVAAADCLADTEAPATDPAPWFARASGDSPLR